MVFCAFNRGKVDEFFIILKGSESLFEVELTAKAAKVWKRER